MRIVGTAAMALILGACNAPDQATEPAEPAVDTAMAGSGDELDLQATGIAIPPQGGSAALDVPFGSNGDAAQLTLESVLGGITGSHDATGDCDLHSLAYEGMTLFFDEDRFVGYFATAPYLPELTRTDILADPIFSLVEGSSLGDEFLIGDVDGPVISGLLEGEGDQSGVTALWAGQTCVFR